MFTSEILYTETQRIKNWLWFLILAFISIGVYATIKDLTLQTLTTHSFNLVILIALPLFVIVFISLLKLETQITQHGIYVKFFPFHFQFKFYSWHDILFIDVLTYKPLLEYGGWGLRWSIKGNGKAYTMSGNVGLKLVLRNNNQLLIGTSNATELQTIIDAIKKESKPD